MTTEHTCNVEELQKRIDELVIRIDGQEEEIDSILTDISELNKKIYGEDMDGGELDFEADGDWDL